MDVHAHMIRLAIGPLWAWWEGSPYLRHYRQLQRTQYDDAATIARRQWQCIRELARHAYDTAPFYRDRFDRAGVRPEAIDGPEAYRRVPILTKDDIRARGSAMISSQYDRNSLFVKKTSGSTGVSLEVRVDEASMQWKRACTLRSDEWSGWQRGERVAMLWGPSAYLERGWRGRLRNSLLERTVGLNTLKMDEDSLEAFVRRLRRKRPPLIFGHAHSVYLLASYVRSAGHDDIRPRGIITTAMVLHDWQRKLIEAAFGCKVTNRYGCEELSLIACECEQHTGLHVNADGVYVEIERDGRPVGPGESGSLIVTDLNNRAMPLLRYQVGDVGAWAGRSCPCGRGLPLLDRLEGREADFVTTPSGEMISGISLTENFALQIPGIAQLQIIQERVDRFRFRIVRGPDFGVKSLERMRELVAKRFGPGVAHECEYVDRIPPEASGKYRFCISRVPNRFARDLIAQE
jgi:phenylacetate-CoA ligase